MLQSRHPHDRSDERVVLKARGLIRASHAVVAVEEISLCKLRRRRGNERESKSRAMKVRRRCILVTDLARFDFSSFAISCAPSVSLSFVAKLPSRWTTKGAREREREEQEKGPRNQFVSAVFLIQFSKQSK